MQLAYSASLAVIVSSIFSLIWVWFWTRKQDINNKTTITVFVGGIIAVLLAVSLQKILDILIPNEPPIVVFLWATIEEILKLSVVLCVIKFFKFDKTKVVIYMILVALSFAFFENIIYAIFHSINNLNSLLINFQRSIGAALMHIVSSGVVGVALAFSFYKSAKKRAIIISLALTLAIVLHTTYNLIVTRLDSLNDWFGLTFIIIWIFTFVLVCIIYRKENIKTLIGQLSILVLIITLFFSSIVYLKPKLPKYTPETVANWQEALRNVGESRVGFANTNIELTKSLSALDSIYLQLKTITMTMEENRDLSTEEKKFMENYDVYVDKYNCILRKEEVGDSTEGCNL